MFDPYSATILKVVFIPRKFHPKKCVQLEVLVRTHNMNKARDRAENWFLKQDRDRKLYRAIIVIPEVIELNDE